MLDEEPANTLERQAADLDGTENVRQEAVA
jgi:hypothetical protein